MELYIRSQDKEILGKYTRFYTEVNIDCDWCIFGDNGVRINDLLSEDNYFYTTDNLGIYESRERCLEILDELENFVILADCPKIFRMPKE